MQRIIVLGCGGAGKSTFSLHLGEVLCIPVIHLDKLFWKSGWKPIPREEFAQAQQAILENPEWIIDGNYSGTMELRMAAADTIVFLDMPTHLCLYGAVTRWIQNRVLGRDRLDMTAGNRERLDREYLGWIVGYRKRTRPRILRLLSEMAHQKNVSILCSRAEVREYLEAAANRRIVR